MPATARSSTDAKRGRGRPRTLSPDERRLCLVEAAETIFHKHGYAVASVEEIAHFAGMSKATVYRLFDSKQALFSALVELRSSEFLANIFAATDGSPRTALENFLRQAARTALSPRLVALLRLVISEAPNSPGLARTFEKQSVRRCQALIADWLRRSPGLAFHRDPDEVAGLLYGATIAEPQLRLLLGADEASTLAGIDEQVHRSLAFYLSDGR